MPGGVIGFGIWCVDTTYKLKKIPDRGKLEPIKSTFNCVGGGPSNVLTDLFALGFSSPMIAMGSIGIDANAKFIKQHCKKNQIDISHLIGSSMPTAFTICMTEEKKERTFLYFPGANDSLSFKNFKLDQLKYKPKILYVGYPTLLGKLDYFSKNSLGLNQVLKKAKKNNLTTVIDLVSNNDPNFQKIIFNLLSFTDYLLMNEIEAKLLFKQSITNDNKKLNKKILIKLSKKIFQKGLLKGLIIHSAKESLFISKDDIIHTKSKNVPQSKIINSIGAGDAFCAGFIFGIHENWPIEMTLQKAHAAGSKMMSIDASSGQLPNIKKL